MKWGLVLVTLPICLRLLYHTDVSKVDCQRGSNHWILCDILVCVYFTVVNGQHWTHQPNIYFIYVPICMSTYTCIYTVMYIYITVYRYYRLMVCIYIFIYIMSVYSSICLCLSRVCMLLLLTSIHCLTSLTPSGYNLILCQHSSSLCYAVLMTNCTIQIVKQ